uniref:RRM domain-containing protein n=1 Tax=Arcella intermedia TaxID=1963864 RepID=A0A6B2LB13_9EUKA
MFVSGLPGDVREREIHNLFRFFFGYEGCILNEKAKQPVAFVCFAEREFAIIALRYLHDIRMDLNSPQKLRIEFAKSNSKTKRLSPQDLFPTDRRGPIGVNPSFCPPPPFSYPPPHFPLTGGPPFIPAPWKRPPKIPLPSHSPCSTLFIANIHPDVQERDLEKLFANTKGFRRLKMGGKEGVPICFVEFSDTYSSSVALNHFQGSVVGGNPIRIEYAKAKMGDPKYRKEDLPSPNEPQNQPQIQNQPYEISGIQQKPEKH